MTFQQIAETAERELLLTGVHVAILNGRIYYMQGRLVIAERGASWRNATMTWRNGCTMNQERWIRIHTNAYER